MYVQLKKQWNDFPSHVRALIELLISFASLLILLGVYFWLIPNNIAIKDEFITWVGLASFIVTFWGFLKSWQAASRSEGIENSLIEVGLLSSGIKEDFTNIFNEHLIKEINSFRKTPGNIYLSLSTLAYGYGVLGKNKCQKLFESFNNLLPDSQIELLIFSPDAHYNYWANLIFWSIARSSEDLDKDEGFINGFAFLTNGIINTLSDKKCSIWLKKETTVRFFAYESLDNKPKKAYVSLVDSISIYQNQYGSGFKARSLPIQLTQIKEFIDEDSSFFHRIKSSPYSLKVNDLPALKFGGINHEMDKKLASALKWDFILGRTSYDQYAPGNARFRMECDFFIENFKKEYVDIYAREGGNSDDIFKSILLRFFYYYKYLCVKYYIVDEGIVSNIQHGRIIDSLKKANHEDFNKLREYFDIAVIGNEDEISWFELLYDALTSGFGESVYVMKINGQNS